MSDSLSRLALKLLDQVPEKVVQAEKGADHATRTAPASANGVLVAIQLWPENLEVETWLGRARGVRVQKERAVVGAIGRECLE